MSRPKSKMLLLACGMLAGCGHSPPTRTLSIAFVPPVAAPRDSILTVRVVHFRMPAILNRVEVASPSGAGEVLIDDFAHWGAPVDKLAGEAFGLDLAARLPKGAVVQANDPTSATVALSVDVLSFELHDGRAAMKASWTAVPADKGFPAFTRSPDLVVTTSGSGSIATAKAIADLTAQLADQVVAMLSTA